MLPVTRAKSNLFNHSNWIVCTQVESVALLNCLLMVGVQSHQLRLLSTWDANVIGIVIGIFWFILQLVCTKTALVLSRIYQFYLGIMWIYHAIHERYFKYYANQRKKLFKFTRKQHTHTNELPNLRKIFPSFKLADFSSQQCKQTQFHFDFVK